MKAAYRTDVQGVRATRLRLSELLEELDDVTPAPAPVPAPADSARDGATHADAAPDELGEAVADPERHVTESLDGLRDHGWAVLHGLTSTDHPGATVDHVAVGPGGVVVVHVRSWSGTVSVADGRLRQNGYRRDRELYRAAAVTRAVARALPARHRDDTIGVICLACHDQELAPTSAGVPVVGGDQLADVVRSAPARLTADQVADIVAALGRRWSPDPVPHPHSSGEHAAPRPWIPAWAPWRR